MADIAVFDFDGTIIPSNSFNLFIKYLYRKNITVYNIINLGCSSFLRKLRVISSLEFKNRVLKTLKNKNKSELKQVYYDFTQTLIPLIRRDALKKIKHHNQKNDKVIIISGALYDYLEPLKKELNIDQILGTRLLYKNGVCLGLIDGVEMLGEEKVKILKYYLKQNDLEYEKIICYTDSLSDLPILEASNVRFLINSKMKINKDKHILNERWD